VGVQVIEARQQRLALGVDHLGAARRLHAGSDLGDAAVADDHIGQVRSRAGGVENRRAHDRDDLAVTGLGRLGNTENGQSEGRGQGHGPANGFLDKLHFDAIP
jgi:hypothetical protein